MTLKDELINGTVWSAEEQEQALEYLRSAAVEREDGTYFLLLKDLTQSAT